VNYDANVNTTVNKLRLALGDSPEKPMYVETIPRQGYCFLGTVERVNELLKTSGVLTIEAADAVDELAPLFTNGWERRFFCAEY
jgi:DNA-binding winged helix-turn-helix (wHTH) protein